jgi:2-polyprenyl-3-methyl-5-hydroxy-6-metoxy-1,4-benzoquinol methylase
MQTTDYRNPAVVRQYARQTLAAIYICHPALLRAVGEVRGKAILDLGCGAGGLARALWARGARVVGVDNSRR